MRETMSSRERIEAVLAGGEPDRFPVWLKMANPTWRSSQPEPYRSMDAVELLRAAGCDVMVGCDLPGRAVKARRPHVSIRHETEAGLRRTIIETPDGDLIGENALDPFTNSWHPTRFFGDTPDRFRCLRWHVRDTAYEVDAEIAEEGRRRQRQFVADDVYTMSGVGPAPLMNLIEHLCGPENTIYYMVDLPDLFEEMLELMHQDRLRYLRAVLPHVPSDSFWMSENTSTTLISPQMFRRYAAPHLAAYGALVRDHGVSPVHHMCGTLNALLEDIDALPAVANEAFTTRPLGDVSLAEGRARMPSKALIGGTNATLWLESVETIVATVAADVAACPDRSKLFLTSAGVLPPPVGFDKARAVVDGLKVI